jgi:hypothetical protein
MYIKDLILEIGFTTLPKSPHSYELSRNYTNFYSEDNTELFSYGPDTNGVYNLILQRTNFVPIRVEVIDENEQLVYDFISNHFGIEYVRNFKLNKIL